MWLNRVVNACRRAFDLPFWSLANYLKPRLGNADGAWVESCTALVEDRSGRLSLCSWTPAEQASARKEAMEVAA